MPGYVYMPSAALDILGFALHGDLNFFLTDLCYSRVNFQCHVIFATVNSWGFVSYFQVKQQTCSVKASTLAASKQALASSSFPIFLLCMCSCPDKHDFIIRSRMDEDRFWIRPGMSGGRGSTWSRLGTVLWQELFHRKRRRPWRPGLQEAGRSIQVLTAEL